jgi:hypothetical protein
MPTFAEKLAEEIGPFDGYLLQDPVQLREATTLSGNKLASVSRYNPWEHSTTSTVLALHAAAIYRTLSVRIISREGVYGRMCTLYCGWRAAGANAPTTVAGMLALKGAFSRTIGGTGDPGMFSQTIPCPFDGAMEKVLKAPYNEGVRPVFYYAFVETVLTKEPPDADRFVLEFEGHFDVFGRE